MIPTTRTTTTTTKTEKENIVGGNIQTDKKHGLAFAQNREEMLKLREIMRNVVRTSDDQHITINFLA